MGNKQPLLDLATLVDRPTVVIDGHTYEILSPGELGLVDLLRLDSWSNRINELMAGGEITDVHGGELIEILTKLTDRILFDVPDVARDRLTDQQRLQVAQVFTNLPGWPAREKGEQREMAPVSNGANSSPASSASMADDRKAGSAIPPSPSSEHTS